MIPATCNDGLVHLFGYIDEVLDKTPACGAKVPFGKPAGDSDPMCLACVDRGDAWASGDSLGKGS